MNEDISRFLRETQDAREYKRALAVKFSTTDLPYAEIGKLLEVSPAFISKWKRIYQEHGVEGFRIGYIGSEGFLSAEERAAVLTWLKEQKQWNVPLLQQHLKTTYDVEYQSLQSYYDLLKAAGLSWKKTQAQSPKKTIHKSLRSERS